MPGWRVTSQAHRCTAYPSSAPTDIQWASLEPLLPPPGNTAVRGGRPEHTAAEQFSMHLLGGIRRDRVTATVIDSQSIKGADAVHGPTRGFNAAKELNGRKRQIAVDTSGLLLTVVVTSASIQDRGGALRLATLRTVLSTITPAWAYGGYPCRLVSWAKSVLHLTIQSVKRRDDTPMVDLRSDILRAPGWK